MSVYQFENGEYSLNPAKYGDEGPAAEVVEHPVNVFDMFDTEQQDRNSNIQPHVEERCYICQRPLGKNPWMIHHDVFGGLYSKAEEAGLEAAGENVYDDEHSQGYWSIGSSCAKKIPAEYRVKIKENA